MNEWIKEKTNADERDEDLRKNIKRKRDSSDRIDVLRLTNLAWNWSAAGSRMNESVNKVIEYFKNQNLSSTKRRRKNSWILFFRLEYHEKAAFRWAKLAVILISVMNKYSNYFVQVNSLNLSACHRMARRLPVEVYKNYTMAVKITFLVHSFLLSLCTTLTHRKSKSLVSYLFHLCLLIFPIFRMHMSATNGNKISSYAARLRNNLSQIVSCDFGCCGKEWDAGPMTYNEKKLNDVHATWYMVSLGLMTNKKGDLIEGHFIMYT